MEMLVPIEMIEKKIFMIHGQKVMIDMDLARLYGVSTSQFNRAIKRNKNRFPFDFMFRLTKSEYKALRCHFGISMKTNKIKGGRRYLPYAFTEQGVAMLSGILNSRRAIQVNIAIMRTFVKLRKILSTNRVLVNKLNQLEKRIESHDIEIKSVFDAIRALMKPNEKSNKKIGFLQ